MQEGIVEERKHFVHPDDVIDVREYSAVIRKAWWKVVLFSLAVGIVTLIVMFQLPNMYQATAVLTPGTDEKKQIPALGALASFGIDLGGPSKVEDLETLFKSHDLTVRVFKKYSLWPLVLADRYDSATGKVKASWTERLFRIASQPREPGYWDAVRASKDTLKISMNKKAGTLSVSFLSTSPVPAPKIVGYYLEEAKNRLQEEALDRSMKNKKFLEAQIGKTVDTLTRDRLYALFGQEVEREMLAHNREQFGFRVIDAPQIPDRKFRPLRGLISLLATVVSFFLGCVFFIARGTNGKKYINNTKDIDAL
ncbi:MAG: putative rane protein [Deltaproteobacteria bacterium]|nr:putative rane protein [Deltaproteobacteria bacterium]MBS1243686.1 putative rane protein [Deltaproteobacteria bacterium]